MYDKMTDCGLCGAQGILEEKAVNFVKKLLTFSSGIRNIEYDRTKQRGKYGNSN